MARKLHILPKIAIPLYIGIICILIFFGIENANHKIVQKLDKSTRILIDKISPAKE